MKIAIEELRLQANIFEINCGKRAINGLEDIHAINRREHVIAAVVYEIFEWLPPPAIHKHQENIIDTLRQQSKSAAIFVEKGVGKSPTRTGRFRLEKPNFEAAPKPKKGYSNGN